jgi:winged helix domain-containing protein
VTATAQRLIADPNLSHLDAELCLLGLRLDALAAQSEPDPLEWRRSEKRLSELRQEAEARRWPLHLLRLARVFRLTELERQFLLLAAAPELDAALGQQIARVQGTDGPWPTVSLAWRLCCSDEESWLSSREALRPDAPLFRFQLLRPLEEQAAMPDQSMRVDRRIADALLGSRLPDARLASALRIQSTEADSPELTPRGATQAIRW